MRSKNNHIFNKVFKQYSSPLLIYAQTFVELETAEDIIQNLFLKLWDEKYIDLHSKHLKDYLYKCTRNACIDFIRQRKNSGLELNSAFYDMDNIELTDDKSTDYNSNQQDNLKLVKEATEKLPPACRKIFKAAYFSDYSHKEIAEQLNISLRTVENQVYRGLSSIRTHLLIKVKS